MLVSAGLQAGKENANWESLGIPRGPAQRGDPEHLGRLKKEAAPGNVRRDCVLLPRGEEGCPHHPHSCLLYITYP